MFWKKRSVRCLNQISWLLGGSESRDEQAIATLRAGQATPKRSLDCSRVNALFNLDLNITVYPGTFVDSSTHCHRCSVPGLVSSRFTDIQIAFDIDCRLPLAYCSWTPPHQPSVATYEPKHSIPSEPTARSSNNNHLNGQ